MREKEIEIMDDLERILSWINHYSHNDVIDRELLALEILEIDPHASRRFIFMKICEAGRAVEKERRAREAYARMKDFNELHSKEIVQSLLSHSDLSHDEKYALFLKFWKGLSLSSISLEMQRPVGTISQLIHSAISKLRLTSYSQELSHELQSPSRL